MHELVRKHSRYVIANGDADESFVSHMGYSDLPAIPSSKEVDKATWKEYMLTGRSDRESIHGTLSDSWQRCLKMGVDPAIGKCVDIRAEKELGREHRLLKGLVMDTQKEIYTLIRGKGLLVTVCDRHGYLVGMGGDIVALLAADKLNFGPGANWSEQSVGTNAIGTALATGRPMRVSGREHFCESHHGWICSAAPIFDLNGDPIGCLDISGPKASDHTHALALAIEGARAIESRLFRTQSANLMSTLFNAVMTGMVYADWRGKIRAANPTAAILMGTSAEALVGADAAAWFDLKSAFPRLTCSPEATADGGVRIRCTHNPAYEAKAVPVHGPNQTLAGVLIVITERQSFCSSRFRDAPDTSDAFNAVIGNSPPIRQAIETARRVAPTPTTVLITGDSGTGKEVLAKAIHNASPRRKHPFVPVNCGAIPAELIQSELFGYVEGAFTGACRGGAAGKFEQAAGGTLFLDEIGEMPLTMQVNLLRLLDEKKFTRVGGRTAITVDVRIIAATNRDLKIMVDQGDFRPDLYYRLNVVCLHLPPLKSRGGDVQQLAGHFINQVAQALGRPIRSVEPQFYQGLAAHPWPGNIRELHHAIESAITLMDGDVLRWENLPASIRGPVPPPTADGLSGFNLAMLQQEAIHQAFIHFQGNISQMSRALGIGRNTLYAKLKKLNLIKEG